MSVLISDFWVLSLDSLVECSTCGQGIIEVKCPYSCRGVESTATSFEERADSCSSRTTSTSFCLKKDSGDGSMILDRGHQYYYQYQLQLFVTGRNYCDFVVWSESETHIEHITADEPFLEHTIPLVYKFWRMCVLPELMGKVYTRELHLLMTSNDAEPMAAEEDQGRWCYCKDEKGGDMVGSDNKSCTIKWFHIECLGMETSSIPQGKWLCPTCHADKYKQKRLIKTIVSSTQHES